MARDKVMPSVLSLTSSKGVPWVATVVVATVTAILAVTFASHVETMTTLVTFGALSSYVFLHADVIVQCVFKEGSRKWVRHLVVPILGALTLLIALAKTEEMTRIVGLSWLAAGVIGAIITRVHRSRQAGKLTSHQA